MAPHETEVISALNLLRDTPSEILNTHRHLALQTLAQIGRVLNSSDNECPSHSSDVESSSRHLDDAVVAESAITQGDASSQGLPIHLPSREHPVLSSTSPLQNGTKKRKRQTSQTARKPAPVNLIDLIKQRLPSILEFCRTKPSCHGLLEIEQEMQFTDKRIDHLKQVDGNKTPSEEQKLLKGLSQLSLAQQFTAWETKNGWKSKMDILYHRIRVAAAKNRGSHRGGKMTQFAREHGYPKSDHNVVRKGIQRGLNQLLFSKLMEDVASTLDQKRAIQGLLARVTIFEHTAFQSISIFELPALVTSLVRDHESFFGPQSDDNMDLTLVSDLSKWFENMTVDFEMVSRLARARRDPLRTTHAQVANESVVLDARHEDCLSENRETSDLQTNSAVYPGAHELTTFARLPRIESSNRRMSLHSSFTQFESTPGEVGILPDTGSHDMAQFFGNANNTDHIRDTGSCSEAHELSLFSRGPSSVSAQPHLCAPLLCSSFRNDVPSPLSTFQTISDVTPHEVSSFSTIPA